MSYEVRRIVYFDKEGRLNLPDTLRTVRSRASRSDIAKVVAFTRDGNSAVELRSMLTRSKMVIAVTFSAAHPFYDKEGKRFSHPLADPTSREKLEALGIPVVIGTMPLQEIVIPRVEDAKIMGIRHALNLLGGGTFLCVQAVTMATDAGHLTPGEKTLVFTADTAMVVRASSSVYMFHPQEGLEIQELLCKPSNLDISFVRKDD